MACSITNCNWNSLGTTSVNSFVLTANDIDSCSLLDNVITQVTTVDAAILLTVTAGVLTNLMVERNYGYRKNTTTANGSLINVGGTTSTGYVALNRVQTLTTTADKLFTDHRWPRRLREPRDRRRRRHRVRDSGG
jgi:hypothetical protein